ncbi:MAG: FG-GAP repeat protein, partial [Xanthomonadales bacterium]|nr:FG-GAP repeat protein [Xanthomonadales bacterium]
MYSNAKSTVHNYTNAVQNHLVVLDRGKQLPTPYSLSAENSAFGHSLSVDLFFGAIGAPNADGKGAVLVNANGGFGDFSPLITLKAEDRTTGDQFGHSVTLTADYILVGAPGDDDKGSDSGSVYVFEEEYNQVHGHDWQQQAKLTGLDGQENDFFGFASSMDGQRIVVGAYGHDSIADNAGAVYVFEFNGIEWQQTAKLTANDGQASDQFGWSVSLLENRVVVGAPGKNNGPSTGAVYVFDYNGVQWLQSIKLISQNNGDNRLGRSLSQNGNRIIVGAASDNPSLSGEAIIYQYDNGLWLEEAVLEPNGANTIDPHFGWSVDLKGSTAVVSSISESGSVSVYKLVNGFWELFQELGEVNAQVDDQFGYAVSISDELIAQYIFTSNPLDDEVIDDSGSVTVFENYSGYAQIGEINAHQWTKNDEFGTSVSISGNRALVGAPNDNDFGFDSGSANIYEFVNGQWQLITKLLPEDGSVNDRFGYSVSLSGDRALIGAYTDSQEEIKSGAAYVFELENGDWVQVSKLKAADPRFSAYFGRSVSLSGSRALIGAFRDGEAGANAGAAYVFELINGQWEETEKLIASTTNIGDYFGGSVSLDDDQALIGARFDET